MNDSIKPNRKLFDIFAVLSLVLGLLGIIVIIFQLKGLSSGFFGELFFAPVCSLVGLICGIAGLMKSTRKSFSRWGVATCIICLLLWVAIAYTIISFWAN
jgi:hypothetical protein